MANKITTDEAVALASYETFGEEYAAAVEGNAYNAHFERPSTLALLPEVSGKKVLDAGCGPGAYTKILLELKASVTGVDVSPAMLEIAKKKFGGQVQFHLHDLSKPMTMFGDGTFDLILSSLAVHYISDLNVLFREFYRLLKTGGHVVFSTHHPFLDFADSPSQNYFQKELLEQEWNTISKPVKVRFYRRALSEITGAVTDGGFVIEKMTEGILSESLRRGFPDVYARLSKNPQFLFLRLRK